MYKVEKNIPVPGKKTRGCATERYINKYKWIDELEDGDSIVCNRRESSNIINYCKRRGIKVIQKWVDERSWYGHGYAEDGKYRLWFYPAVGENESERI